MAYNFDEVIDRRNTDSLKYDFAARRGMPEDILPLWVADMDFKAPEEVIEALVAKSQHGIFGYSDSREDYFDVLYKWFDDRFDWQIEPNWLVKTPGVVYGVTTAIRALTEAGDGVLIQEPVYYPFKESIEMNNRQVVINELVYEGGKYHIDFHDFEQQIVEKKVKMFVLCSPHNPVGRVWRKEELLQMGDICIKHGVIIVSDEIHADFVYPSHKHYVFADLKESYKDQTITCTAPSKTFNLAALQISNIFIADRRKRHKFRKAIVRGGYSQPNIMGLVACSAAYQYGEPWLEALKAYLKENLDFMRDYLEANIPGAKLVEPEGTYLVWVDVSGVKRFNGLMSKDVDRFIAHDAGVWLDGGTMFGAGGKGFQRFNIACPRATLELALKKIVHALKE